MKKRLIILPFILSFFSILYAAEIGCLSYDGDIRELKDSTIKVSDKAVALNPGFRLETIVDTIITINKKSSIFFIIDHSGSMCYDGASDFPQDQWGRRFRVVYDLIDTLRIVRPKIEIGVCVFREHLFFDPADSSFFVQHPSYPFGSYMPFFRIDSSYAEYGGRPGWQILKNLMETDTILADDDPFSSDSPGYRYLSLKYWPANYESNAVSTNINVGFDAAKHAFQSAKYSKTIQQIIFISAGEATVANGPHSNPNDFEAGDSVPATFTLYFTEQGGIPSSIQNMTENIQNNGWSTNNPKSKAWEINPGQSDLVQFVMDSIISLTYMAIWNEVYIYPVDLIINGITGQNPWDTVPGIFYFDEDLQLTGETTDFDYIITYTKAKDSILPNGDTIVIVGDSTAGGAFSVVVEPAVSDLPDWYPNDFDMIRWDRSLGFYYKNDPVTSINKSMDTLEICFTEKEIDILYGYDSVSVTITNTKGNIDSEYFLLSKTDTCFTKLFTVAIDSTPTQNDGILQLFDRDTVTAVFRNPKLPLDTLEFSVPFYPTTAIGLNSYSNQKTLSLNIINSSLLFNLPNSGNTKLQIFNMKGRLLTTLVDSYKQAGRYKVNFDEKRYGAGVYFIKLKANGSEVSRKVTVVR